MKYEVCEKSKKKAKNDVESKTLKGLFPNGVPSGTNDPILASKLSTGSIFTFT
jgi:hypothetical protein